MGGKFLLRIEDTDRARSTEAAIEAILDGLRWLDLHSHRRFNQSFKSISAEQRISIVDEIAYPKKAKPEMAQGVAFFNLMRNLTSTGFYTSQMGVKDLGYVGNAPNRWNGVPADVLAQYGVAYSEKEEKECVKYE
jgi:hypothetical protein